MIFEVAGPFKLHKQGGRPGVIDNGRLAEFWAEVDCELVDWRGSGLSSARGCYVFSIKAGRGALPWYVGRAERQPFCVECQENSKIIHYDRALNAAGQGTPQLFFLPAVTPTGFFKAPTKGGKEIPEIRELEKYLIHMAVMRNRRLRNTANTKAWRNMEVPGIVNPGRGRPTGPANDLMLVLGL